MYPIRALAFLRGAVLCAATFLAATEASGQVLPPGVIGRLGAPGMRHGTNVSALALSADGKRVASFAWDRTVKVWDIASGQLVYQTTAGSRWNYDVIDLSADGSLLAVPGQNVTTLHDLAAKKPLRTVPGFQARFSPDAKHLATVAHEAGGAKHRVQIIKVESGKPLLSCGLYATMMHDFAFAPDGRTLAGVGDDSVVYLWDTATGKETVRFTGHRAAVESAAFSPDGKQVVSASHDGTVRLWDTATGKEARRFGRLADGLDDVRERASRVAFSPHGKRLFVLWSAGDRASVIDLAGGRTVRSLRGNRAGHAPIGRAVCGQSQTMAWLSGPGGVIHVTDLNNGRELTASLLPTHVAALAVTSDGRTVAFSDSGSVSFWDVAGGKQRLTLTGPGTAAQTLAFSLDGTLLATGSLSDTTVSLWNTATGKEARTLHGHINGTQRVWFTPDGRSLLVQDNAGVVHRWDPVGGKEVGQHWLKRGFAVNLTADGRQALMRYYDRMTRLNESRLVDVASGKTRRVLPPDVTGQLTPDGRFLAALGTTNDRSVRLWSASTGRLVRRMALPPSEPSSAGRSLGGGGHFLVFTPDGWSAAAAQGTRVACLYEVATGRERRRLSGHAAPIRTAALSPDGHVLVTADHDGTVLVWDLFHRHGPAPKAPTPAELDGHWQQLANADAGKAFISVCLLARVPEQAVPFLRERLKPVLSTDPQHVARLVTDLDSNNFTARQKATQELEKLGDLTEDALRRAFDSKPTLETRQRIERLLEKLDGQQLNADGVRFLRSLEVLEAIATPDVRQIVEALAEGAKGARLTREAEASLQRLGQPAQR